MLSLVSRVLRQRRDHEHVALLTILHVLRSFLIFFLLAAFHNDHF